MRAVLYGDAQEWERVAGARDELVDQCHRWLRGFCRSDYSSFSAEGLGAERALWIVDRLCGASCPGWVRELKNPALEGQLLFVIGRRDPDMLRELCPKRLDGWDRYGCSAWVSATSPGEGLLSWYDLPLSTCRIGATYSTLPVDEYALRGGDDGVLLGLVASSRDTVAIPAARHLLRRAAPDIPRPHGPRLHVVRSLKEGGRSELAEAFSARFPLARYARVLHGMTRELLMWKAESHDLDAVAKLAGKWGEFSRSAALERLVELTPQDRPGIWRQVMESAEGSLCAARRYCEWLAAGDSERLIPILRHPDSEMAACAFHTYMYVASPDRVAKVIEDFGFDWMKGAWSRFQYAPPPLRPARYLPDVQDVEWDFRLHDPFNVRSY